MTKTIKAPKSKSVKSSKQPPPENPDTTQTNNTTLTPRSSRKQQLLNMLGRQGGASSADIIAVTGWLPHTLRAALSSLRKQGHVIERLKAEDGSSLYRIMGGGK